MLRRLSLLAALAVSLPAFANDSTAELGTGGPILSRSGVISMEKEDLSISPEWVEVDYKHKYCFDKGFESAVLKAAKEAPDGYPQLMESRISYVLTTGGNWANSTIGAFKLTVDKGDSRNIVSFCGENVKKTGPTTFEMTASDFYPGKDIDILILMPFDRKGG